MDVGDKGISLLECADPRLEIRYFQSAADPDFSFLLRSGHDLVVSRKEDKTLGVGVLFSFERRRGWRGTESKGNFQENQKDKPKANFHRKQSYGLLPSQLLLVEVYHQVLTNRLWQCHLTNILAISTFREFSKRRSQCLIFLEL